MSKKTHQAMQYERDLDSEWTVKNKKPVFGMKEHASVDVESGLILSTCVSKASVNDTNYFPYVVTKNLHGKGNPKNMYADKGYCSEANRDFLNMNNMGYGIMRKNQIHARLTEFEIERNIGGRPKRLKLSQKNNEKIKSKLCKPFIFSHSATLLKSPFNCL